MWIGGFIKLVGVAILIHLLTKWFGERPAPSTAPAAYGLPDDGTPPPEHARNGRAAQHAPLH